MRQFVPDFRQQQSELLEEITRISNAYTDQDFFKLMEKIGPLDSANLELWLKDLSESVPLAHGILAVLYYGRKNYNDAISEVQEVLPIFPNTPFWQNLFLHALHDGAEAEIRSSS